VTFREQYGDFDDWTPKQVEAFWLLLEEQGRRQRMTTDRRRFTAAPALCPQTSRS
jgi:hypothetical protein